jgi:hypothetical protein
MKNTAKFVIPENLFQRSRIPDISLDRIEVPVATIALFQVDIHARETLPKQMLNKQSS